MTGVSITSNERGNEHKLGFFCYRGIENEQKPYIGRELNTIFLKDSLYGAHFSATYYHFNRKLLTLLGKLLTLSFCSICAKFIEPLSYVECFNAPESHIHTLA